MTTNRISVAEYKRRVNENNAYMEKVFKSRFKYFDIGKLNTVNSKVGDRTAISLNNHYYDILCSSIIGALADIDSPYGHDAIILKNNKPIEIECKTTYIDPETFSLGPRGGVNCIKHPGAISFQVNGEDHKHTKNRPCYSVIIDDRNGRILDANVISGANIVKLLSRIDNKTGKQRTGKIFISWDDQIKYGTPVKLPWPVLGKDEFFKEIHKKIGKI